MLENKSRKEYFKDRRKNKYSFNVLIDKEKGEKLDNFLKNNNITKVKFLIEAIDNIQE